MTTNNYRVLSQALAAIEATTDVRWLQNLMVDSDQPLALSKAAEARLKQLRRKKQCALGHEPH